MAILRALDGKFYILDDSALEGKEVDQKDIKNLPESLPEPPAPEGEEGVVEGHWPHHWWYNWHNHHWHDFHHGH